MIRANVCVLAAFVLVGCAVASSTNSIQLTDTRQCGTGLLSPDGTCVVYTKHDVVLPAAENDGRAITAVTVRMWRDGQTTDLLRLEPGEATARGKTVLKQRWATMYWLADGDWLLVRDRAVATKRGYGGTLIRMSDGWSTRVGAAGNWYVANDPIDIDGETEKELSRSLRWGDDGTALGRLRGKLPERSADYLYHWTDVSPGGRYVTGMLYDAHFDGCTCSQGMRKSFIGLWDTRRGKCRRLTWSENGRASFPSFSPDGKYITYVIRDFYSIDKPSEWAHLRLLTPDGRVRRRLAPESDHVDGAWWLDEKRVVYGYFVGKQPVSAGSYSGAERHLAVLDVETGERRGLTKGHFRHDLLAHHGNRFLVAESNCDAQRQQPSADLYIVELPDGRDTKLAAR